MIDVPEPPPSGQLPQPRPLRPMCLGGENEFSRNDSPPTLTLDSPSKLTLDGDEMEADLAARSLAAELLPFAEEEERRVQRLLDLEVL